MSNSNAAVAPVTDGQQWIPGWTFADRLRRIRRSLDMGQREFAEKIGQKLGTYQQWEADITRPRDQVAIAKRVELFTRVPAAWILGLDAEKPQPAGPTGAGARPEGFEPPTFWLGAKPVYTVPGTVTDITTKRERAGAVERRRGPAKRFAHNARNDDQAA